MARFGFAFMNSDVRFGSPATQSHHTMITLSRFLDNPFDDARISLGTLLAFTPDHVQRMIATNPGGELTPRIAATQSALQRVADTLSDDTTRLALRKARVQAKDNFRETLPAAVAKIFAAVTAKYGVDSIILIECCPQGRSIFSSSPDTGLEAHLRTLVSGITAHVADLGQPLVAEATGLRTGWAALLTASAAATGAKTSTKESKQQARENLQLMLYLNLLKLAELFPRQPEKLALYMQQSYFDEPAPAEDVPVPGPAPMPVNG